MAHGGEHHGVVRDAGALTGGLGEPGGGGRQVEHLDDGRALGAGEAAVEPADDVGCYAPLLVGRPGERDERVVAGDEVAHLHGVAHGVDVLDAGLHAVVHDDAALDARLKPRRIRKGRIGRDADGEHHHVGAQRLFAGQEHVDAAIALLEALHGAPQRQTHPVGAHLLVDEGGHVGVEGAHEVARPLHDGHVQPQLAQVLGHFQADEPAAAHHGRARALRIDEVLHREGVLDGAQGEKPVEPRAGKLRLGGSRAGREDELVVGLLEHLAGIQVAHGHHMALCVDGLHLVAGAHIHVEAGAEALRSLQGEGALIGDGAPDVVGQPAVGVGDVAGTLEYDDLGRLIEAPKPGRRRGAAGHASYDNDFHRTSLLAFSLAHSIAEPCCRQRSRRGDCPWRGRPFYGQVTGRWRSGNAWMQGGNGSVEDGGTLPKARVMGL